MRTAFPAASAMAVAVISITGCGGGSKASATQKPLSNHVLAAKADAICERLRTELNGADVAAGGTTLADRGKLSVLFGEAEERASNQLAELKPKASEGPEWQKIVASRRALVPYHHKLTEYATRGEKAKVEATYAAYKVAQRHMLNNFKYSPIGFKICWDIG